MHQDAALSLPSASTHLFFNSKFIAILNLLCKQGLTSVDNLLQAAENSLSQWFWQSISTLPRGYFTKDITATNYSDKSLWEGIFYDRLALLKEQVIAEAAENWLQHSAKSQAMTGVGLSIAGTLKEQMAAGLPQEKPSVAEQLIALQGIVGKYTLSPQCYEQGLESLQEMLSDSTHCTETIEKIRTTFRASLKTQSEFLTECFQGDVFAAFKESARKSASIKRIVKYYKPLMKHKVFIKQHDWLKACYDAQTLIPPPTVKKYQVNLCLSETLSNTEREQDRLTWQGSISRLGKFICGNAGKLLTLGLAAQVTSGQALSANTTRQGFALALEDKFPLFPILGFNENNNLLEKTHNQDLRRTARAAPTKKRETCTVSKDKLTGLIKKVNDSLSNNAIVSITQGNNYCELNSNNLDNCDELITLIQCNVTHLKNGFENNKNKISADEFIQSNKHYKELLEEYNKGIDDAKESASKPLKLKIATLQTDMQSLKNSLENTRVRLKSTIKNLCASEIHSGRIESAISSFNALEDNNHLSDIIEKSYNSLSDKEKNDYEKKINNFDNIVDFIRELPYINQTAIAYTSLYKMMESNNNLGSPKILTFSDMVEECMGMSNYINVVQHNKDQFTILKNNLKTHADSVISAWGSVIRNNNGYEQIKSYANQTLRAANSFNSHLPAIIIATYANSIAYAETAIKFVDNLSTTEQKIIAYPTLFNEMNRTNGLNGHELVMLAYRVKELMDKGISADNNDFQEIKEKLPSGIKKLLWNDTIFINSRKHNNNYLGKTKTQCGGKACNFSKPLTCPSSERDFLKNWRINISERGRYFEFPWSADYRLDWKFSYQPEVNCDSSWYHLWEIIPIENGKYFYFKEKDSDIILASDNDLLGFWGSFLKPGSKDCSNLIGYKEYTGDLSQQWKID